MTKVPTLLGRPWTAAAMACVAVLAAGATAALAQPPPAASTPSTPAAPPAPPAAAATPPSEFAICSACHESTANARPSLGPNLWNVGGRKAGSVADYDYSPAMKASGITWSADTLTAFITDPAKTVPGNKMDYPGADPAAAKAIADYLMTLKG
jgi:cytochrome c